jgi:hypothetical protein
VPKYEFAEHLARLGGASIWVNPDVIDAVRRSIGNAERRWLLESSDSCRPAPGPLRPRHRISSFGVRAAGAG